MSWTRIEGKWDQVYFAAQQQWNRLTDEDMQVARYDQSALAARLKDRYGLEENDAQKQVLSFILKNNT